MNKAASSNDAPGVIWPCDLERFYAISKPTRIRWESLGTLPARTVRMGTQSGWLAKDLPDVAEWLANRRAQEQLVAEHIAAVAGTAVML
jgi:predicted DNA-binding transcriptional regulator AlpA